MSSGERSSSRSPLAAFRRELCCVGGGWTDAAASPGEILDATTRHSRKCARDAAEAFLCGLPLARRGHTPVLPPDWAFGADPPSLGKFVARWAMELWLGSGERPARRLAVNYAAGCGAPGRAGPRLGRGSRGRALVRFGSVNEESEVGTAPVPTQRVELASRTELRGGLTSAHACPQ